MKTSQKRSIAALRLAARPQRVARRSRRCDVAPARERAQDRAAGRRARRAGSAAARAPTARSRRCGRARRSPAARAARAAPSRARRSARGSARYSVKQPSAMCWPLSGGGSGSPSRRGSVCTAPPSVGRASCSVTSCPPSTSSSAALRPGEPAADDRDPHREQPRAHDRAASSATRAEATRRRRRSRAPRSGRASRGRDPAKVETQAALRAVERLEQPEPFVQVRPRARGLERHQRAPLRRRRGPRRCRPRRRRRRSSSSCGR